MPFHDDNDVAVVFLPTSLIQEPVAFVWMAIATMATHPPMMIDFLVVAVDRMAW